MNFKFGPWLQVSLPGCSGAVAVAAVVAVDTAEPVPPAEGCPHHRSTPVPRSPKQQKHYKMLQKHYKK